MNDYAVEIPVSDAIDDGPIFACARNGAQMSTRDKGPLWIVSPYDSSKKYRSKLLALNNALLKVQETSDSSLHEMRRRLDVFYNRVKTLMTSAPYAQLRKTGTTLAELGQVQAFLSSADPVIDGGAPYLRQSLPELAAQAEKLHPAVRIVSLSGIKVFSGKAAPQRPGVVNLLGFVSSITLALIDVLLLFLALLLWINRQARKC
jgi:hypothetical protein